MEWKFTEWLPAITGVATLLANLLITYLNMKNSRTLEREKKKWEVHANTLHGLEELKHKMETVETPEGFDLNKVQWALKEGASREKLFNAITQHLSAQAEGFHFVLAEFRAKSHLFDPDLREVVLQQLEVCKKLAAEVGPDVSHTDKPMDASGLKWIDTFTKARQTFINLVSTQLDIAIDRYRAILR
jgi:hypothetical protein